ncbi:MULTISPECIES: 4-amino-4-deoxy-L-arabinose-phosphoundecaprenol flippase subunit ArnF [unclassified Pantoea]|uniref:4-amino-4-deoxy-L-arabinose-phosphoundecaprenol flippase subunit ArnF n=1 Tax=unclassified Pantoea TaxID=2630326 RepID=UPI001232AC7D|nr:MULTISPECIES: 4-amino-4-deoxy-L-arabinose-phosphoundecaprenol flippase subunit ArnF [unclassified Pantoea]KAA5967111.1 4-amino-4-deoxy-L-arabinose-phospho-UDP flippase [Pantoea sp. M_6]KAA5973909.1 4-amino-4-deoxy-L-arabinose-phospho-UDP flippase [Pantoea sp. M_8]KAA5987099.1 4-amino-4-deoxy-L-arabinose-phospho-UDP flippase [Pantoea sp. M_10]KAA6000908.1 4-amino-4-deoxy-L-arabinose-phospho-UDP flippase [Pantoea sp. M_5]
MKGYGWVACSVLLVSAAQLMMRWAMPQLPDVSSLTSLPAICLLPALLLVAGLGAYGLSMLCWIRALGHFPLNRVYPLLSLSYVLVWLAAVSLPVFHEAFSWHSLAGVVMIVIGLLCIVVKP